MLINGYGRYGRMRGLGHSLGGLQFNGRGASFSGVQFGDVDLGTLIAGIGTAVGQITTGIGNVVAASNRPSGTTTTYPFGPNTQYPPGTQQPQPTPQQQPGLDPMLLIGGGVAVLGLVLLLRR